MLIACFAYNRNANYCLAPLMSNKRDSSTPEYVNINFTTIILIIILIIQCFKHILCNSSPLSFFNDSMLCLSL